MSPDLTVIALLRIIAGCVDQQLSIKLMTEKTINLEYFYGNSHPLKPGPNITNWANGDNPELMKYLSNADKTIQAEREVHYDPKPVDNLDLPYLLPGDIIDLRMEEYDEQTGEPISYLICLEVIEFNESSRRLQVRCICGAEHLIQDLEPNENHQPVTLFLLGNATEDPYIPYEPALYRNDYAVFEDQDGNRTSTPLINSIVLCKII